MRFEAVIFDLDGTLLDTLEDLADAVNCVLRAQGFPVHPVDAYRHFVGDGARMLMWRALPEEERADARVAAYLEAFREEYARNWHAKTRPYEGIPELLDALTERRVKMAVLTNKPQEFAEQCVQELLSGWTFAAVLGQRAGKALKPDPAGCHEIARRLDVPLSAFLYLGDSGVDMTTAARAGICPVGALWGFREEGELRKHGAIEIVKRPEELLGLLG